jgi:hypothetical protein
MKFEALILARLAARNRKYISGVTQAFKFSKRISLKRQSEAKRVASLCVSIIFLRSLCFALKFFTKRFSKANDFRSNSLYDKANLKRQSELKATKRILI